MAKIQMTTPLVEMDGDEMTRILWKMIKDELLTPFIDLKTEYYDLGLEYRNETNDQVTLDSAEATKKYGVAVKCATITPNAARMTEYNLKEIRDLKYFLSPVLYTDKLIRARDYITKDDFVKDKYNRLIKATIISVLSKQSQWEYEKEWRIINVVKNESDRYISMPLPKVVYVGFKVNTENREKI